MDSRKLDHVKQELGHYSGLKKQVGSGSHFVLCPYHSERTPSGRIFHSDSTRSPGFFRCYGCGKKAPWDEVAPLLGLKPYKWTKPVDQYASIQKKEESKTEREIEFSDLQEGKVWRGIKTSFLVQVVGAQMCRVVYDTGFKSQKMLFFPVMVKGRSRGYIRARLKKVDDKPSYLNAPGPWSHDYGLFLYDQAVALMESRGWTTLVLVEGPRDALRLLSMGIPAIAILGTQSWSKRKSQLVELTGAKTVVLCMDGDDAGLDAIRLIRPLLSTMVRTRFFDLTGPDSPYWQFRRKDEPTKAAKASGVDLWDPASMPIKKVKELRSWMT